MEETLLRFPHIGDAIFKELNDNDFCKSMEVNRSWNSFINKRRVLQKAYKKRIQHKIQTLTAGNRSKSPITAARKNFMNLSRSDSLLSGSRNRVLSHKSRSRSARNDESRS